MILPYKPLERLNDKQQKMPTYYAIRELNSSVVPYLSNYN